MSAGRARARPAAAASRRASAMRRAPKPWRTRRSPCTPWCTRAVPPTRALEDAQSRGDRAAVRAIALGTLRWYLRLAPALESLVSRPFDELSPKLAALLVTAAHQVEYSRGAPEAQVHLAVDASRVVGRGARQRHGQRGAASLRGAARRVVSCRRRGPRAGATRIRAGWSMKSPPPGANARRSLLAANNQHPPMALRVDPAQLTVADFLRAWRALGREAHAVEWNPEAVVLEHPAAVQMLPGFESGAVSVQDCARAAGRAACSTRGPACACSMPARHPAARHCTLPNARRRWVSWWRWIMIRCGCSAYGTISSAAGRQALLISADLTAPVPSLAAASFDRVLVDAPCSGSGVIRRHPDIKLLRRPGDIDAFAATQRRILRTAFELLRPGGRLIYCTCSVLPDENERVVAAFLAEEPRAAAGEWTEGLARPPGLIERDRGLAVAARWRCGHRWLLLCLPA